MHRFQCFIFSRHLILQPVVQRIVDPILEVLEDKSHWVFVLLNIKRPEEPEYDF